MKPPWEKVEALYHAALEREPGRRAAFLEEACVNDSALRLEVASLLAETDHAADFLERPAIELEAEALSHDLSVSLVGVSLNHYRLVSLLGTGGMAEVYLAHDTQLERAVAVKVLHATGGMDISDVDRLQREARLLASLNHPNIASVYGFEQTDRVCALVMELVEGETLTEQIARGPLQVGEALDIARQIAAGVEAAHAKNIVHRDLKPANVKVTRDGKVKILDFGVATMIEPDRTSIDGQLIVGTLAYMSPEQARGTDVDKQTDVWAWGCILYEMLAGSRIARENPDWAKLPEATPAAVRTLLVRCLEKDPRRRLHDLANARIELENAATADSASDSDIALSSPVARALFLSIQLGYLAMYCAALFYVSGLENALLAARLGPVELTQPLVIVTAMTGIAVRLYLLSSVGLGHPAAGRNFHRLFPILLVFDGAWAAAPLLASRTIGIGVALAASAGLAYLPFSQRTLIARLYR